ncbi:MAG: PAS domain S-box protein, partial [Desulfobulbaceae bacterium]|nr:PAS domain S-box protein [Desulfobulbaceae bacterium]
MNNAIDDLRSLYRSARRMSSSNDVNMLLDFLVEDLVNSTEFERVLVLRLYSSLQSLEAFVYYGFQKPAGNHYQLPFKQINGLLKKVYSNREPLNVINYIELEDPSPTYSKTCGILRDDYRVSMEQNRRPRINLCIPGFNADEWRSGKYKRFKHYSMMHIDRHDKTICHLLGKINSFLILPICDDKEFYGYVLADKSLSGKEITYKEIRQSSALVKHAAHAVGRAGKQHEMLERIADQLNEINQLKSFYQSIIQNLRSGLITVDQLLKINSVNRTAEVILGYTSDELLGKSLDYLFPNTDDNNECIFSIFHDAADEIDSSMGLVVEVPMHRKNGEVFPAEICYSVITDNKDDINGLSCIIRDITSRKSMEQDLARVDKLASLGELAAGVAHEIKNPLAGIAGVMQIMIRNHDKDDPHFFIFHEVLDQVKRLDSFVNDLLQFGRPGQTKFTNVNLKEIIKKTLFLITAQLEEKNITVHEEITGKPLSIRGDAGQLQQVLLNILINAVDAMNKGGNLTIKSHWEDSPNVVTNLRKKCVNHSDCLKSGKIKISIADNGKGIDPDSLESIFNPFHTTKGNGTGLGLSISHRIIEQHGGSITVKSKPGLGSTFTIHLPIYSD